MEQTIDVTLSGVRVSTALAKAIAGKDALLQENITKTFVITDSMTAKEVASAFYRSTILLRLHQFERTNMACEFVDAFKASTLKRFDACEFLHLATFNHGAPDPD